MYIQFVFVLLVSAVSKTQSQKKSFQHPFHTLTSTKAKSVSSCCEIDSMFNDILPNILKVRVPDTEGHSSVKQFITSQLRRLDNSQWEITEDTFFDLTPNGNKTFTNIIATLNSEVPQRLVLAAHYDSKYFKRFEFVGATDSAIPVALILDMILSLDSKLKERKNLHHSLQIIFFDGEEAFKEWKESDSLYGSRHLAEEMDKPNGLLSVGNKTGIQAIKFFILLDLLGSIEPFPRFHNWYKTGETIFEKLMDIESRLKKADVLRSHSKNHFISGSLYGSYIQDDHIPFYIRGVPIVHIIPSPFPSVWHTSSDNLDAIDRAHVQNLKKIFMVFLYEYFYL